MSTNPFDLIIERLNKIENHLVSPNTITLQPEIPLVVDFKYYPIQNLFNQKVCSKPTFYKHLKAGKYDLYKFGEKSFVLLEEFYAAFHKISFKKKDNNKDRGRSP